MGDQREWTIYFCDEYGEPHGVVNECHCDGGGDGHARSGTVVKVVPESELARVREERDQLQEALDDLDAYHRAQGNALLQRVREERDEARAELAKTINGMTNGQRSEFHGRRAIERYQRAAELAVDEKRQAEALAARYREALEEARERLVEVWHCGDSDKPLHEFLGMTWADYAAWVSPDVLASPPEERP